ncbi:MAG TPA: hypothetical protein VLJ59_06265 [Mycobacteriales bacterium]|nr:hypothetical protein [Mycobacteriales bacterium]
MSGADWAAWIGVGVALIAILATILIARLQQQRKVLAFEAYTEFPLFAQGPIVSDIEISAEGRRLAVPHILLVTIKNSGNRALRPEDFYGPIQVKFTDAKIVTLHIQPDPPTLAPEIEITSEASFIINPILLNAAEGFVCYGLLDGCPHRLTVDARIADTQIRDVTRASVSQSLLGRVRLRFDFFGISIELTRQNSPTRRVPASNTVPPKRD